ncbi:trypsin-like serine peptidase [Peredibacter starrii]|uniref:Serine protease n=1 Tax=Peredibacter starrii TaxID=28202 RepID=A0AAX4HUR3_9BACT|nr:serine protease [Peredibacter starrii]WPU67034.1 serine protease [Peredibacter starrii]
MKTLFALAFALVSTAAFAFPVAPHNALERSNLKSVQSFEARNYDFEGIVKLSNCSGSLVAFNGMPLTAKAIMMTNGHCVSAPGGFLKPGEVWVNRSAPRSLKLYDVNFKLHNIQATKILFATMTNTDVAFYELTESYNEIIARTKVRPFLLDSVRPQAGVSIDIISGYWDRGYSCDIDGFVYQIREADWTFTDSIRYTEGCDTIGGTSGSPIIARGERRVIGINNTSNESGRRCTMNNPCEVDQAGQVEVRKGVRYGQQTYNVYTCLTPDFNFDLSRRGCTLPR